MTIQALNKTSKKQLKLELSKCCGATAWIDKMAAAFPIKDEQELLKISKQKWSECTEQDWLEAFTHHPKIGDVKSLFEKFASTAKWASGEQSAVNTATNKIIDELAKGNAQYEQKFGFIFIVCATGKTAEEMLALLNKRMSNSIKKELKIAAGEQQKITQLRLKKLVA